MACIKCKFVFMIIFYSNRSESGGDEKIYMKKLVLVTLVLQSADQRLPALLHSAPPADNGSM